MSRTIDHLSDETLAALDRALYQISATKGLKESGSASGSRQARHARIARARSLAVAACALLAADDDRIAAAFVSPDFATLRPLSAKVHSKFVYLASQHPPSTASLKRSWSRGFGRLCELATVRSGEETLSMQSAFCLMFAAAIAGGQRFGELWKQTWSDASRRGLLDRRHVRMNLAVMGSFVGHCHAHVEWTTDTRTRSHEMADIYTFVRRDEADDLLEMTANLVRGRPVDPRDALYPPKPLSTIRFLLRYVRTCLRDPCHFSNEGHVLMVLTWVAEAARMLDELRPSSEADEFRSGLDELQRTERVMQIEKARFWRVYDGVRETRLRERLAGLWKLRIGDGGRTLIGPDSGTRRGRFLGAHR